MLSLLPFWRARFERYSAAACAAGSIPSPLSAGSVMPLFLCQRSIRLRARSHTSLFVMTSHRPSLARMRQSSSFARGRNITSGSGMIHGFKYLSPASHNQRYNAFICFLCPITQSFNMPLEVWKFNVYNLFSRSDIQTTPLKSRRTQMLNKQLSLHMTIKTSLCWEGWTTKNMYKPLHK